MQLNRKTRRIIVMVIAGLFILFGVLDYFIRLNINEKLLSNISFVLMAFCLVLLFLPDKPGKKDKSSEDNSNNSTQEPK